MNGVEKKYLSPTAIINSDHPEVLAFARDTIGNSQNLIEKSTKLYYAVRDKILYDPYYPFYLPEHYRASNILKSGRGYCVCKAALLCALGRACKIPSRIGFATVRNHLATKQLVQFMGTDQFVYHGFTEFYLENQWVKATPAFNIELCKRHKVAPLEFDGRVDSIFHAFNQEHKKFMEYTAFHGSYADIPIDALLAEWRKVYGKDRIEKWINAFEATGGKPLADFSKEDLL